MINSAAGPTYPKLLENASYPLSSSLSEGEPDGICRKGLGPEAGADLFSFHEKTMYRGKDIRIDDEIFVFASSRPSTMGRESG
jgi:hypothetical protein